MSIGNIFIFNEKSLLFFNLIKNKNVIFVLLVYVDMNNNYVILDVCIFFVLINKFLYFMIYKRKYFIVCIFKFFWIYYLYLYKVSKSMLFYCYC